ncbi:hypothetical protein TNCV_4703711 [Trichonephila clavipes]|nr:hypothetical protein TNCV_4703711 [Trichonephila clavipes]
MRNCADILIVYGDADCSGHAARWLFQEHYPNRHVPHHTTFVSVNKRDYMRMFLQRVNWSFWCTRHLSVEDLITRVSVVPGKIHDMPGIFQNQGRFNH